MFTGIPSGKLLQEMKTIKAGEINPEDGKVFAYVYTAEGDTFELQRSEREHVRDKGVLQAEQIEVNGAAVTSQRPEILINLAPACEQAPCRE